MAQALGVSQQTVSNLENSEEIDEVRLKEVAEALGVSAEALRNFSDEAVINYISTYNDNSSGPFGPNGNFQCTFNPLDKLVQVYEEKEKLYERLLKAEMDKVGYLEKLLDK